MLKRIKALAKNRILVAAVIFLIGLAIRINFATTLPVTNDEGAYLYDTLNIRNGQVPLQDFLTKSLPFIYTLTLAQDISGNSLVSGRFLIIILSAVSAIFLYLLTKRLFNEKVGALSAVFYWAFPLVAAYTTLIHTEPMQMVFVLGSYYFLVLYFEENKISKLLIASLLISVAFFVRQSSIVSLIWPLILGFIYRKRGIFKKSLHYLFLSLALNSLVFLISVSKIGYYKSLELVGMGAVNLSVSQKSALSIKQMLMYPINFLNEFVFEASNLFRDGQLITIFFLIFFIYFLLSIRNIYDRYKNPVLNIGIIAILGLIFFLQSRYNLYTSLWKIDAIPHLNFILAALFATTYLLIFYIYKLKVARMNNFSALFSLGWLFSLFVVYMIWIKFRSPYLIEFFPPILIMASYSIVEVAKSIKSAKDNNLRNVTQVLFVLFILIGFAGSFLFNRRVYFTGLHTVRDLKEIEFFLRESGSQDVVLTASVIFPYLSGDRVLYDISHPAWYGYPTIPEPVLLSYFPPFSKINEALKNGEPKYVIRDPFTNSSYFTGMKGKELEKVLNANYTLVKSVGRASIYEKKPQEEK